MSKARRITPPAQRVATARDWAAAIDLVTSAFDLMLLASPGWRILLEIYIGQAEGRAVEISAATAASGVSEPTAMRHIAQLCSDGLTERLERPDLHTLDTIRLTHKGLAQMDEVLDHVVVELRAGAPRIVRAIR